ncbi:MAG: SAP domain-containing protein [Gammaproteobacteria bacterium]|nr:SAP domain-containing protein [Gammaproteobacteria bacterium]
MNMQDIRRIAKQNGLKTGKLSKVSLVKKIQATEGNFDCFATAENDYCDQADCIWKNDCFQLAKKSFKLS